jgi:hypothetical protein
MEVKRRMNNKMNLVFIPVITLLVLTMALAPVSAATIERTTIRGAFGRWVFDDSFGEEIVIEVTVLDDTSGISINMTIIFEWGDPSHEFLGVIAPSEFRWSIGACSVSTEIEADDEGVPFILPITVEWDITPPTLRDTVRETNGVRVISNTVSREGLSVATLTTIETPGGDPVTFYDGYGKVWETTSLIITR